MPIRRTLTLTEAQRQELTDHRDHDPRPYVRERCAALLKIAAGAAPHAVARQGLLKARDPDTLYEWLTWYEREGFWSVEQFQHGGAHRRSPLRREELRARLQQGPAPTDAATAPVAALPPVAAPAPTVAAPAAVPPTTTSPPASRWKLDTIRASFAWLDGYSLSGIWRLLRRNGLRLRGAAIQHYSPDPDYQKKVDRLCECLRAASRAPGEIVLLFLDERGYTRWPEAARDWAAVAPTPPPLARRAGPNNQQGRTVGALNALSGQVTYLDGYIVLYVVLDNWSIHRHPEVLAALALYPQVELVWLPTYAPWLNPIEKLWRWLRQGVLNLHRQADDWAGLRQHVHEFLDQFVEGSQELLQYVGLLGEGLLASTLKLKPS